MRPQLKFSCPENWNSISAEGAGRYCGKCEKVVTDFSKMSNEEILQEISVPKTENPCGSFKAYQLDQPFNDKRNHLIRLYQRIYTSSAKRNIRRAVQLSLATVLLFLSGCHRRLTGYYAPVSRHDLRKIHREQMKSDSTRSDYSKKRKERVQF